MVLLRPPSTKPIPRSSSESNVALLKLSAILPLLPNVVRAELQATRWSFSSEDDLASPSQSLPEIVSDFLGLRLCTLHLFGLLGEPGIASFIHHCPNLVTLYLSFDEGYSTAHPLDTLRSLRRLQSLHLVWFNRTDDARDGLDGSLDRLTAKADRTLLLSRLHHSHTLPIEIGVPFVSHFASSLQDLEMTFEPPNSSFPPHLIPIHLPGLTRFVTDIAQLPLMVHYLRLRETPIIHLELTSLNAPEEIWRPLLALVRDLRSTLQTLFIFEVSQMTMSRGPGPWFSFSDVYKELEGSCTAQGVGLGYEEED